MLPASGGRSESGERRETKGDNRRRTSSGVASGDATVHVRGEGTSISLFGLCEAAVDPKPPKLIVATEFSNSHASARILTSATGRVVFAVTGPRISVTSSIS